MKTWKFLTNVFLNVCKNSYKIAFTISNYHDARLQANQTDPFFGPLYQLYHPLHINLSNAYSSWQSQSNKRSGSTLTLDQLLILLSPTKANYWEHKINDFFDKKSPEYKVLFPLGLKSFYKGSKDSRINAVKTLYESKLLYPVLSELSTDVIDFHKKLVDVRSNQLGNKGATTDKSAALESAIYDAMVVMYSNLGLLMSHFSDDPPQAGSFFDLETIRSQEQLVYRRTIKGGKQKNVLNHTFMAGNTINVINDSNVDLLFYLAPTKAATKEGLLTVTVAQNSTEIINMSDLNILNPFLNVENDTADAGHCIVELL